MYRQLAYAVVRAWQSFLTSDHHHLSNFLRFFDALRIDQPQRQTSPLLPITEEGTATVDSIIDVEMLALARRRATLVARIQPCNTVCHINGLPADILTEIFMALVDRRTERHKLSLTHPSMVVSHVCRHWRSVALSRPLLWAELTVMPPDFPGGSGYYSQFLPQVLVEDALRRWGIMMKRTIELARTWITRSGDCPLSVALIISRSYENSNHPSVGWYPHLVKLLCSTSSRWQEAMFELGTPNEATLSPILALRPEDVPILEALGFYPDVEQSVGVLAGHSLRTLSLAGVYQLHTTLNVNWKGLTRLSVQGHSPRALVTSFGPVEALNLLRLCPNLVSCDLGGIYPDGDPDEGPYLPPSDYGAVVPLPFLTSLTIRDSILPSRSWLDAVYLPSLHTLHIIDCETTDLNVHTFEKGETKISAWIRHLGSQLTELRFDFSPLRMTEIAPCLKALPNLRTLWIDLARQPRSRRSDIGEALQSTITLLRLLTHDEDNNKANSSPICPRLERLVGRFQLDSVSEDILVKLIASRRSNPHVSPLTEVNLTLATLDRIDLERTLESQGVDLTGFSLKIVTATRMPLVYPDVSIIGDRFPQKAEKPWVL